MPAKLFDTGALLRRRNNYKGILLAFGVFSVQFRSYLVWPGGAARVLGKNIYCNKLLLRHDVFQSFVFSSLNFPQRAGR